MLVNHVCIRNGSSTLKLDNGVVISIYTFNFATISFASWYITITKNTQDPSNNGKTFKCVTPKHREKTLQTIITQRIPYHL